MSDRALVAPACPGTDWLAGGRRILQLGKARSKMLLESECQEMSARLVGLLLRRCEKDFLSDLKAEQKPEEQLLSFQHGGAAIGSIAPAPKAAPCFCVFKPTLYQQAALQTNLLQENGPTAASCWRTKTLISTNLPDWMLTLWLLL